MTRTQIKRCAQDELMGAMRAAFTHVFENVPYSYSQSDAETVIAEMDVQMARTERLFGYVPGSWARGC